MSNAARLANQIVNDAQSELGLIPLAARKLMVETYTESIKEVKVGGIFFANIYDETTKKRFTKGYEVA